MYGLVDVNNVNTLTYKSEAYSPGKEKETKT